MPLFRSPLALYRLTRKPEHVQEGGLPSIDPPDECGQYRLVAGGGCYAVSMYGIKTQAMLLSIGVVLTVRSVS